MTVLEVSPLGERDILMSVLNLSSGIGAKMELPRDAAERTGQVSK